MILSRRHLLAAFGLALPAATILAPKANATSATHHKHGKHGHATHASHKHHKPSSRPATTQG